MSRHQVLIARLKGLAAARNSIRQPANVYRGPREQIETSFYFMYRGRWLIQLTDSGLCAEIRSICDVWTLDTCVVTHASASVTGGITDVDPTNNTAVAATVVAEAPIYVSAPGTVIGKKVNNQTVATFTHANGIEPASAFTATIDWGDGTTSAGTISLSKSTYSVTGSHTYAGSGSHTITTTVVEAGSSPNFAAALATTTSTSTQTGTTTGQTQPTATFAEPARLTPAAVDQVIDVAPLSRRSSALHTSPEAASDDMLDEIFALN